MLVDRQKYIYMARKVIPPFFHTGGRDSWSQLASRYAPVKRKTALTKAVFSLLIYDTSVFGTHLVVLAVANFQISHGQ
jgi:hypothetical protein